MSYLDKIRACNAWEPTAFVPFIRRGERLGSLRLSSAEELRRWPRRFRVTDTAVEWIETPDDFEGCTLALAEVARGLVDEGVIPYLHGEQYPVTAGGREAARCLVDRACAPFFGMRAFGQHLNGFVRTARGIEMWIGRRSADRRLYPGRLDNLVAGGLPHGVTLVENLRKECAEEAGMSPSLADRAVAVGAVTYCRDSERGLKPDVMFCYDLELPEDFEPRCTDGEVEAFYRLPVDEVAEIVRDTDDFKLNCNLVIIDFLIRHGLIPQDDSQYVAIAQGLRSPLPASDRRPTPTN
jgi:8-oxo-dGTP pyrophosphatase MutT (NUDIX family)